MKHSDYHGKLLRLAMVFVALFLCGTMAYAQTDRMISGIVVDENGDPLPAAHIRQVSQTKGEELAAVITDMNGHFRLTLLRTAKEIEISYLGYESKKVRLTSANSYRIILEPASELLDEVVVTGYQTISRERATGSFAKVDSKKLETQRLSSVSSLMEGRIAGYSDGKIRGVTSMNGLTTPLYVIDGFPVEKTISDGLGNWVENVPDLNIEDIENITVLKDAAATSIYGARAANGVILVTTKQGKEGKIQISYDGNIGWQNVYKMATPLSAKEYMIAEDMMRFNQGLPTYNWSEFIDADLLEAYKNGTNPGTNWLELLRNKNAITTSHALNVAGGNDRSKFSMGAGYQLQVSGSAFIPCIIQKKQ